MMSKQLIGASAGKGCTHQIFADNSIPIPHQFLAVFFTIHKEVAVITE